MKPLFTTDKPSKILVLGGCRSGKSRFAEESVATHFTTRTFIATLDPADDAEMARRIKLHQKTRADDWLTVEEPVHIARVLTENQNRTDAFVVDCLTLWITNLMLRDLSDAAIEEKVHELGRTVQHLEKTVLLVANEVGLGLVPESPMGRRFRDLAGWTNQHMAKICDSVFFVAAGLPMCLKEKLKK